MGDSEEVVAIEEQWPDALARRDRAWLEAHTAADFVFVTPDGGLIDRSTYLERSEVGNDAIVSRHNTADEARVVGDVAVVLGRLDVVARGPDGGERPLRYRYTSVYVRSGSTWLASTAQLTPVAGDA